MILQASRRFSRKVSFQSPTSSRFRTQRSTERTGGEGAVAVGSGAPLRRERRVRIAVHPARDVISAKARITALWTRGCLGDLLNRTNFQSINNIVGDIRIQDLPDPLVGRRGVPTDPLSFASAFDPRQFQVGLRINY
jgi:hypothetical protein